VKNKLYHFNDRLKRLPAGPYNEAVRSILHLHNLFLHY